jgi:FdhE protein
MPLASSVSQWEARISRACELAAADPAARETLTFYAALAAYQRSCHDRWVRDDTLTLDAVHAEIPSFLSWLSGNGPSGLSALAVELARVDRAEWRRLLGSDLESTVPSWSDPSGRVSDHEKSDDSRSDPTDRAMAFVLDALLQPLAELTAGTNADATLALDSFPVRCPSCATLPVVGVLREAGHGSKRLLVCARCLTEREHLRVVCVACGEQQFDALPVYTADRFPHLRIDACDRCRRYLKTIDLTKDGLAVPVVDDIASVSLDLWARERGYVRVRDNLLGL